MRSKIFNICNIYIALLCIFYMGGFMFPREGAINQAITALIILLSIIYYIKAVCRFRLPRTLKALNILLIVLSIYGLFLLLYGSVPDPEDKPKYAYLRDIFLSILPVFSCYYFSRKGDLNYNMLRVLLPVFFVVSIISFVTYYRMQLAAALEIGSIRTEFVNNSSFNFVALLAASVIYLNKPKWFFLSILLCVIFIFAGMKRSAILICALQLIYIFNYVRKTIKINKFVMVIGILGLFLGVYFFYIKVLENSELFLSRIEDTLEGNTSNRDIIYGSLWKHFTEKAGLLEQMFGNGAEATLTIAGIHAHNDWLELLTNQGLFGIVVYIGFYFAFIREIISSRKSSLIHIYLGAIFILIFVRSFVSMSYMDIPFFASIYLGYFLSGSFLFQNKKICE